MNALITNTDAGNRAKLVQLVLDSVSSPNSKRAYKMSLLDFFRWYDSEPARPPFSKAVVLAHKAMLEARGLRSSSINVRLSAVRKLATEAADNNLLDPVLAGGIARIKGVPRLGRRMGNWLSRDDAERLINAPDCSKLKGVRDRALLCVLLGCGLRRSEAANLTIEHVQQREGRWIICDLVGKHGRCRSVPMPSWAKMALDAWTAAAGITEGNLFRPVNKGGRITATSIDDKGIAACVKTWAAHCGFENLAAHDLRRSYAKLAHKGRAALEQIQLSLGHSSIATTERYLGCEQDLQDAPCDHLDLRINIAA